MTESSLAQDAARTRTKLPPIGDLVSDPVHHHQFIHDPPHGTAILWQKGVRGTRRSITRKIEPHYRVPDLLHKFVGEDDVFVTVNQFKGYRYVRLLKKIRACYVDIDGYQDVFGVLEYLHEHGIPEPNFIVNSGNGLHLYWALDPAPAQAKSYWSAIQHRLIYMLRPLGADPVARDAARVLRVSGTKNSKSDDLVEGIILNQVPWSLDELGDEVLPYTRAEVRDFKAASARKRAHKAKRTRKGHRRTIFDFFQAFYHDLNTIADHYWFGGIPPGYRDKFLFLSSVALSWFTLGDALRNEIVSTARMSTPGVRKDEVLRQMQTVIRRAEAEAAAHARGESIGRDKGRYWLRRDTARDWIGDLITPELEPKLTALASDETLRERRKRKDARRHKQSREQYEHQAQERRQRAQQLRDSGLAWSDVGAELGISADAARKLATRAR